MPDPITRFFDAVAKRFVRFEEERKQARALKPRPHNKQEPGAAAPPPPARSDVRRKAYLVLLWDTKPWSDAETQSVRSGKAIELGCPVELLKTVQVQGAFPTGPDEFVVSTALLACRERQIPFDSARDTITFSGGQFRPGEGAGLITIEIR